MLEIRVGGSNNNKSEIFLGRGWNLAAFTEYMYKIMCIWGKPYVLPLYGLLNELTKYA